MARLSLPVQRRWRHTRDGSGRDWSGIPPNPGTSTCAAAGCREVPGYSRDTVKVGSCSPAMYKHVCSKTTEGVKHGCGDDIPATGAEVRGSRSKRTECASESQLSRAPTGRCSAASSAMSMHLGSTRFGTPIIRCGVPTALSRWPLSPLRPSRSVLVRRTLALPQAAGDRASLPTRIASARGGSCSDWTSTIAKLSSPAWERHVRQLPSGSTRSPERLG